MLAVYKKGIIKSLHPSTWPLFPLPEPAPSNQGQPHLSSSVIPLPLPLPLPKNEASRPHHHPRQRRRARARRRRRPLRQQLRGQLHLLEQEYLPKHVRRPGGGGQRRQLAVSLGRQRHLGLLRQQLQGQLDRLPVEGLLRELELRDCVAWYVPSLVVICLCPSLSLFTPRRNSLLSLRNSVTVFISSGLTRIPQLLSKRPCLPWWQQLCVLQVLSLVFSHSCSGDGCAIRKRNPIQTGQIPVAMR